MWQIEGSFILLCDVAPGPLRYVHSYVHEYVCRPDADFECLPLLFPPYVLRHSLSLCLDLLDWLASELWGHTWHCLPNTVLQTFTTMPSFDVSSGHLSSCFCAFTRQAVYHLNHIPTPLFVFGTRKYSSPQSQYLCKRHWRQHRKWINFS